MKMIQGATKTLGLLALLFYDTLSRKVADDRQDDMLQGKDILLNINESAQLIIKMIYDQIKVSEIVSLTVCSCLA